MIKSTVGSLRETKAELLKETETSRDNVIEFNKYILLMFRKIISSFAKN